MFMVLSSWQSHCKSSPGSFDECRTAPSGHRPKTKPNDLGCESACTGCQSLHPPSPFVSITQPESWYSFYHPTEGRRLSQLGWFLFTRPLTVTHPGTNRIWRSATTLIEASVLLQKSVVTKVLVKFKYYGCNTSHMLCDTDTTGLFL